MKKIFLAICLLLPLNACMETVVGGTLVSAYVLSSDRDTNYEQIQLDKDKEDYLKKKVKNNKRSKFLKDINIDIVDDRIFLTGVVIEQIYKDEAYTIMSENSNISEIINEIQVRDKEYDSGIGDFFIKRQLKLSFGVMPSIKGSNIVVRVINGTVYLFGIARDKVELQKITETASKTKGVEQVISHIKLSDV